MRSVGEAPGVSLAGFVDDLADVYRDATVAVAPLLRGAGVKFKTLEAILAGLPIVSTSVGAEGIAALPPLETFDSAEEFADGLVAVLESPALARERARSLQNWAQEEYSVRKYASKIQTTYENVIRGGVS